MIITIRLIDILRLMYKEMKAKKYDCEVNKKWSFSIKDAIYILRLLRIKFA